MQDARGNKALLQYVRNIISMGTMGEARAQSQSGSPFPPRSGSPLRSRHTRGLLGACRRCWLLLLVARAHVRRTSAAREPPINNNRSLSPTTETHCIVSRE